MTPEQHTKAFEKTISDLESKYSEEIMVKLGISALTFIKQRVQETGVDAKGQKYPPYSTKDTLIGSTSFLQKGVGERIFGSKAKRKELEWRTIGEGETARRLAILKGGYKKIRELEGRQTDHVDFSVTNDMWNDINIISKSENEVVIGARKESEKKKLEGNTKRKGVILDLSPKEILDLYRTYNLSALQIIRNNGL